MIIDVLIGLIVLVGLYVGYQRGVVQPLLVELFFLGALLLIIRDRHAYTEAMQRYVHANAVLAVFVALIIAVGAAYLGSLIGGRIHQMPVVRGADGFLGVFVHVSFAIIVCYLLLAALLALDKAFAPTFNQPTLSFGQVESIKRQLASNPLTASLVDSRDIARLELESKKPGGARISETPQLDQVESVYRDLVQPQLSGSRLAPVILGLGHRVPGLGRVGPQDLPRAVPKPTPVPPPSPLPSPKA